jgi:hypothetical protein
MLFHELEVEAVHMDHRGALGCWWLLLAGPLLGACAGPGIRVANDTTYVLSQIEITTPSQTESFGTLAPREMSDYVGFSEAYKYAAARFVAAGSQWEINPIDYVDEDELGAGDYTYHLATASTGLDTVYLFTTED